MFKLKFLGLERDLIVVTAPSGTKIAGFNPVGDMELLTKSAEYLVQQIKSNNIKCDIILTTEFKGLPIAQEVARVLGVDYVCLRKEAKCYMGEAVAISSESITSGKSQYYISQIEREKLFKKDVVFVDDVFSTGSTFNTIIKFSQMLNFNLNGCCAILKEDLPDWENKNKNMMYYNEIPVFYCGFLPLQKD